LRFAPEGEVESAPHLSVTFSQPMVAVTSNEDLAASQPPVKLSPQPKGRWRWIGTKTLLFEPDGRFPMATEYTVEIPAGTKSAAGASLGETKRWRFATPPLTLKSKFPTDESQPLNPILFIEFDQKIDQASLLKHIRLRADERELPLRLATAQELANDEEVKALAARAEPGRWLAFRAEEILPADSEIDLSVSPGAASAEGPRVTTDEQSFSFDTYAPLRVVERPCDGVMAPNKCFQWPRWRVRFNNRLADDFDPAKVRVEPEMAGLEIRLDYGGHLSVKGHARPSTTYQIILDASITDIYGQTLGKSVILNINTPSMPLDLFAPGGDLLTLDPAGQKRISIYSVNHQSLRVALYAASPEDYGRFIDAMRERVTYQRNNYRPPPFPEIGHRVFAETIKINAQPDEITDTPIDLRPALRNGLGHALLIVEPVAPVTTSSDPQFIAKWIQSTELGLDAFADRTQLLGWVTSLK
jgi:hypothetical protein